MKKLKHILKNIKIKNGNIDKNAEFIGLQTNSKEVKRGDLFACLSGSFPVSGEYIREAVFRGAAAVICEKNPGIKNSEALIIEVANIKKAFGRVLNNYYPSLAKMEIIGVTGTNGKTTVTILLEKILKTAGYKCGLVGTLGWRITGGPFHELANTTPGPLELARIIDAMYNKAKVKYMIMEVSSHGLSQDRVSGLQFKSAIFTNLSRDHLDYHKNMARYLSSKTLLFQKVRPDGFAVLNRDEAVFKTLKRTFGGRRVTYGLDEKSDYGASDISLTLDKSEFTIEGPDGSFCVKSRLCGIHNVYNILAAASCALELKCKKKDIAQALKNAKNVPGRLQKIEGNQGERIYIDYAHTPDAIRKVTGLLSSLKNPQKKLICVFGCGGDRDKGKRAQMGRAAAKFCDLLIITSDNPRSENPNAIINDIKKGFKKEDLQKCFFMRDRARAIKKALSLASADDIVLIAGKGHERWQIIKNKHIPFSDVRVARRLLNEK